MFGGAEYRTPLGGEGQAKSLARGSATSVAYYRTPQIPERSSVAHCTLLGGEGQAKSLARGVLSFDSE